MKQSTEHRVAALETAAGLDEGKGKLLPYIVSDEVTEEELEKMRAAGLEPLRFSDAADFFAP